MKRHLIILLLSTAISSCSSTSENAISKWGNKIEFVNELDVKIDSLKFIVCDEATMLYPNEIDGQSGIEDNPNFPSSGYPCNVQITVYFNNSQKKLMSSPFDCYHCDIDKYYVLRNDSALYQNHYVMRENDSVDDNKFDVNDREIIEFDLNHDETLDQIKLIEVKTGDPGLYDTLRINLANGDNYSFDSRNRWDSVDIDAVRNLHNTFESDLVFGIKRDSLFFILSFGFQYGCCTKDFTVVGIHNNKASMLFNEEFEVENIIDLNNDGILDVVGRENHPELYSIIDSIGAVIGTYAPFKVYALNQKFELQMDLTIKYNQENYIYLGLEYDESKKIVRPKNDSIKFRTFILKSE